ncbi:MAG: class I SAM-dependent methyltransferase [Nitrospirae bacterium]|nr:class I SAM-dependent methyltransferase [Nitrospirota bacterium]
MTPAIKTHSGDNGGLREFVRIPMDVLCTLTDTANVRNIYIHPNPLARNIFWQRLSCAHKILGKHTARNYNVIDCGGGSGAFLPTLRNLFTEVSVLDLDLGDAREIATYYRMTNIRFFEQDMNSFDTNILYDLVVATDVFEHFADLNEPYQFLKKALRRGGLLLLSLPTENILYRLGRIIVNKSKPLDHYHAAKDIIHYYCNNGYTLQEYHYVPVITLMPVPLFWVGLLKKNT